MINCNYCHLYANKFCAECGKNNRPESPEIIKDNILTYLKEIPIIRSDTSWYNTEGIVLQGMYNHQSPIGSNYSYTDEFIKIIEKLKYTIHKNTYIVKITAFKTNKILQNEKYCELWIKECEITTTNEWPDKNIGYEFARYFNEWWRYAFSYKKIGKDFAITGYGNWLKCDFEPWIEDKLYIYWEEKSLVPYLYTQDHNPLNPMNSKKKIHQHNPDGLCALNPDNPMKCEFKTSEIKINYKNIVLALALNSGIQLKNISYDKQDIDLIDT